MWTLTMHDEVNVDLECALAARSTSRRRAVNGGWVGRRVGPGKASQNVVASSPP
jgi:hypothetical protein